jgi:mono/diheme cytochrome c family protein
MNRGLLPGLLLMAAVLGLLFGLMTNRRATIADSTGDATHGEFIYRNGVNDSPPCLTCHSLSAGGFSLGPAMIGMRQRAEERVTGLSAEDYLRQSILEPMAFVVSGYRPIMYPEFKQHLSEQDLKDVIAFLMTL